MTNDAYDCVIIGGGPGGLVAALYLKRFQRSVAVVNQGKPRAEWIPKTHNLIGYDRGISGSLLLRRLKRQVSIFDLKVYEAVARLFPLQSGFKVDLGDQGMIKAKNVILATGIRDIDPKLDNLFELRKSGLLRYCSICDGFEFSNKPIVVLAQNDFGVQKGLFIAHWTKDIHFILPLGQKLASHRIREIERIHAKVSHCQVLKIKPRSGIQKGIEVFIDQRVPIYAQAAYVELGCRVNDSAFRHLDDLQRTQEGFIITTMEQRTSIKGLFAVGDCVNLLGQISVAAGQSAVAATTIHNDLFSARHLAQVKETHVKVTQAKDIKKAS